jgi:hypothetical protein
MVFGTNRGKVLAVTAVTGVAAALAVGLYAPSGAAAGDRGGHGPQVRLDRVFIIVLENHSQHSAIGDPNTPYITSLAQQYGQAADYFGVTHPSEPNYIAMIGGSNWFTNNDNPANRFDHTNLVGELTASHISWGAYMEAMPASDPLTDFWPSRTDPLYASKHNPFALFTDLRNNPARVANIKPYTDLAGDLNSRHAPRFVFITPDQCNDMHGGVNTAIAGHPETPCPFNNTNDDANDVRLKHNADAFVKGAVTTIMASRAWTRHSAIFIVADEGDFTGTRSTAAGTPRPGAATRPCCPPATLTSAPSGQAACTRRARARGRGRPRRAAPLRQQRPLQPLLAAAHHRRRMGLPELVFASDHAQVTTMDEFLTR